MFFRILKKDLRRKKTMNIILLLFIVLATTFLSSSVNNLLMITNAIPYFNQVSNSTDYFVFAYEDEEMNRWAEKCKYIEDYNVQQMIVSLGDKLYSSGEKLDINGTPFLSSLPKEYNVVVDENDVPLTNIGKGEIALCYNDAEKNGLKVGDDISVTVGDLTKTFTIKHVIKDALLGSEYMGMKRLFISENEYDMFAKEKGVLLVNFYGIMTENTQALEKDLNQSNFNIMSNFTLSMLNNNFIMDMMVAAILIVVSLVLIVISFVILRFTIVFTLQEDYKEIGIMKAIGIRNGKIKRIYLVKYFVMAVIGATVGVMLSFPLSERMLQDVSKNVAIEDSTANLFYNILSGLFIIVLVMGFCYFCAGKLNKFSAMQAIRNGSRGERFRKKSMINLHERKSMVTYFYLAINDIISNFKRYAVLIITFMLGTMLVILPMNAANTLGEDNVIELFGMAVSDVYINNFKSDIYCGNGDLEEMLQDLENMEREYKEVGVEISLYMEYMVYATVYTDDSADSRNIYGSNAKNFDTSNYSYTVGTAPKLPNEVAMTRVSMEALGVSIGDTVQVVIGGETKSYIITGAFQTMSNMGERMRFSNSADVDLKYAVGTNLIQGSFTQGTDKVEAVQIIKEKIPEYEVKNTKEYMDASIGTIRNSIDGIKSMVLILVLVINSFITILLVKTFLVKDMGEIALLKNLGFSNKTIRIWQTLRIVIVLFVSIVLGILASQPLNRPMGQMTFGVMGATDIEMTIKATEVYLMYPLILFVVTSIIALISTSGIRKISFRDINNIE